MSVEGTKHHREVTFFESTGFRALIFAVLLKLTTIEDSIAGYSDLAKQNPSPKTIRNLQKSTTQLGHVVASLQKLLDLQEQYKNLTATTVHPEVLLQSLHTNFAWPKNRITTYNTLLVTIVEPAVTLVLAQLFELEKVSYRNITCSFRRRGDKVILRIYTPHFLWTSAHINTLYRQKNNCIPQLTDTLDIIVLRAGLCVLQKHNIHVSITTLQPQSIYIHLPAARQLQAFALEDLVG
jgi:hypothetical protein